MDKLSTEHIILLSIIAILSLYIIYGCRGRVIETKQKETFESTLNVNTSAKLSSASKQCSDASLSKDILTYVVNDINKQNLH
jgi:hypothetical protein